jgi:hypothetical protein
MSRFAILRHQGPKGLHWDLLLEAGGTLRTWALPALPSAGVELTCQALPDHRLAYLDYEGEISGGRGSVVRCDRGTYRVQCEDADGMELEIDGTKLAGRLFLRRVSEQTSLWRLRWSPRECEAASGP